jgi:hypothetical protein
MISLVNHFSENPFIVLLTWHFEYVFQHSIQIGPRSKL